MNPATSDDWDQRQILCIVYIRCHHDYAMAAASVDDVDVAVVHARAHTQCNLIQNNCSKNMIVIYAE